MNCCTFRTATKKPLQVVSHFVLLGINSFFLGAFLLPQLGTAEEVQTPPKQHVSTASFHDDSKEELRAALDLGSCDADFVYSVREASNTQSPMVVYFGGGPSAPIVGTTAFPVPDSFGLLRFDYPGVGSNERLVECGEWGAERLARILVRILHERRLRTYAVYGVSYGTIPATIFTAMAEGDPALVRPKVLLLEGVIGRAFKPGEVVRGYQDEWQKVLASLPENVREELPEILATQCSPLGWGAWIEQALSIGAMPGKGHVAQEFLVHLVETQSRLGVCKTQRALEISAEARRAYEELVCREFNSTAPDHSHSFVLRDLALRTRAGNVCKGIAMDRAYDATRWQIEHTPIAYFVGLRDPATPPRQAEYHLASQRSTPRIVLEVEQGGHNPLAVALADCAEQLFKDYFVSVNAVQRTRRMRCAQPTRLHVLRPGD